MLLSHRALVCNVGGLHKQNQNPLVLTGLCLPSRSSSSLLSAALSSSTDSVTRERTATGSDSVTRERTAKGYEEQIEGMCA